jgi:hypothetical protein
MTATNRDDFDAFNGPLAGMSPLGRKIMAIKRKRAAAAVAGEREKVWGLTLLLNALVRRADR